MNDFLFQIPTRLYFGKGEEPMVGKRSAGSTAAAASCCITAADPFKRPACTTTCSAT